MERYDYLDRDEAIKILSNMKEKNKNCKVIICTTDFDNDEESRQIATPDEGCLLVRKSKTIVINEDTFLPHVQCFSKKQNIGDILREGIMHDIILGAGVL